MAKKDQESQEKQVLTEWQKRNLEFLRKKETEDSEEFANGKVVHSQEATSNESQPPVKKKVKKKKKTKRKKRKKGNTTSNIVYLTAKAIYDWAVGLFYSKTEVDDLLDAKDIKHTELNLLNDYALSSITTAQKLFNVGTSGNGAFDVDANSLYEFEMFVYLDNLSTTSSNFSFQILGTATYSNILLKTEAIKQTFITGSNVFNGIITATTSYQLVTNSTASTGFIKITGSFRTSSAGTFIPSILLSVANAANVKKGSYAKIKKIGADTFTATSGIS